jgi:tetratricopeptide (TPR) repeat protein
MTAAPETQPSSAHGRKRRAWLVLVLLGVVVIGGVVAFSFIRSGPALPPPPDVQPGDLEQGVVDLVRVARQRVLEEPRSAAAWGTLGQTLLANELEDEASVCFAVAERLDPTNPRWPYYQAGPFLNQGEQEKALPYLRRAVERGDAQDEANQAPRLLLAETLLALDRPDEAKAELQRVQARVNQDPSAAIYEVRAEFDLGLLAADRQEWNTARSHLQRCLGSLPTQRKARLQLAAICQRQGDRAGAEEFRRQAGRLPADTDWYDPFVAEYQNRAVKKKLRYRLAEKLEAGRRFAEAAEILRPMTKQFPDDYLTHMTLGKVLAQLGDGPGAEQALRRSVALAPEKVQAHYYLSLVLYHHGDALSRQGKEKEARKLFAEAAALARHVLTIKPDYGMAHMSLGRSLERLGQRAEGLEELRRAVLCNPEHAELHFQLGKALAEEGQGAEARTRLEKALQLAPPDAPWKQAAKDLLASLKKGEGGKKPAGPQGT